MGWVDIITSIIVVLMLGAIWLRQPSPRSKQRYEVVVSQPDNNPIHLIERK